MRYIELCAVLALVGIISWPTTASANSYTVDCGASGSATVVQNQINALAGSSNNSITVTGACSGSLAVIGADHLTISGLHLTGSIYVSDGRRVTFSNTVLTGGIQVGHSVISFNSLLSISPATQDGVINCISQSDCTFSHLVMFGTGAPAPGAAGLLARSGSRVNLLSGSIGGFDVGVWVWHNAMLFLGGACDGNVSIQSNHSSGAYVSDGGILTSSGMSAADATAAGCSGPMSVSFMSNGNYGVLADGGGKASLYQTTISGHGIDGILVQHGSTMRIQSSSIDAATASGRSGRVKGESHLYFDEQMNGPTAGSTLGGPVCVVGTSSADAENSSTVLNIVPLCPTP